MVEEELVPLNQSSAVLHKALDLIREYRTRLVDDVVTGKLDVRGAALAAEGDELPESDADDGAEAGYDAAAEPEGEEGE